MQVRPELARARRGAADFAFWSESLAGELKAFKFPIDRPPPAPGGEGPACAADTLSPVAPYRLVNIGGGRPERLGRMIDVLEAAIGRPAERIAKPLPPGDVARTHASTELLESLIGTVPSTPITDGIPAFVRWYRDYYRV